MGQRSVHAELLIKIAPGIVEGLAVEFVPIEDAAGAENQRTPHLRQSARRYTVDEGEEIIAKIEHHQRVVVHVGGQDLAAEFTFFDAYA